MSTDSSRTSEYGKSKNEVILHGDKTWLDDIKTKLENGTITEAQWKELQWFFQENKYAPVQPSIMCKGPDCIYFNACPLQRAKLPLPIGNPCAVEESVKHLWFQNLSKELGVSDDGFEALDLGAACDIINILIQKQRVQWEMVDNPEVANRTIVGMTPQGDPIVDMKANPSFFVLKALNQMQLKITESLLATREARSKDESRKTQDATVKFAALESLLQRAKVGHTRQADGSPPPVLETLRDLPEPETDDELLNKED